jgi:hypothetical protein
MSQRFDSNVEAGELALEDQPLSRSPEAISQTPHRPDDVCLPSIHVQKAPIVAGQVEAADGFRYSWPFTGDSSRYQFLERIGFTRDVRDAYS